MKWGLGLEKELHYLEINGIIPSRKGNPGSSKGTLTHSKLALHGGALPSCHGLSALRADGLLDGVVHIVVHPHGHLDGDTKRWRTEVNGNILWQPLDEVKPKGGWIPPQV